jgi:hypothetical protein
MKRLFACSVLLVGIYGCERICGDLQPLPETPAMGGAGAGGEGGVTAGEGGASPVPAGSGAGGVPSEGGGGAGGAAGAVSCSPPLTDTIIDFEDAPASPALGEMVSDGGDPADAIISEMGLNKVYHEGGILPNEGTFGFTFSFNPCVDASDYAAIRFEARGLTPAGVDVSISSASGSDESIHFPTQSTATTDACVPITEDFKNALRELRVTYTPGGSPSDVDLSVDNFVFSPDPCSGT